MRHPSGCCCLPERRGASLYSGGVPQAGRSFRAPAAAWPALSPDAMPRPPNVMLVGRPGGIVSQMAGAISHAVSHVAHGHAGELTGVSRALPGS
jgi:hypothetical protein